jgi:hypothetical protein
VQPRDETLSPGHVVSCLRVRQINDVVAAAAN